MISLFFLSCSSFCLLFSLLHQRWPLRKGSGCCVGWKPCCEVEIIQGLSSGVLVDHQSPSDVVSLLWFRPGSSLCKVLCGRDSSRRPFKSQLKDGAESWDSELNGFPLFHIVFILKYNIPATGNDTKTSLVQVTICTCQCPDTLLDLHIGQAHLTAASSLCFSRANPDPFFWLPWPKRPLICSWTSCDQNHIMRYYVWLLAFSVMSIIRPLGWHLFRFMTWFFAAQLYPTLHLCCLKGHLS